MERITRGIVLGKSKASVLLSHCNATQSAVPFLGRVYRDIPICASARASMCVLSAVSTKVQLSVIKLPCFIPLHSVMSSLCTFVHLHGQALVCTKMGKHI